MLEDEMTGDTYNYYTPNGPKGFETRTSLGWKCELFGMGDTIVLTPQRKIPNWFQRWMQRLFFGNNWIKLE